MDVAKKRPLISILSARFFNSFAYFSIVVIFAVLLTEAPFRFSPGQIAAILAILIAATEGSVILLSTVMKFIDTKLGILAGMSSAALSLFCLCLFQNYNAVTVAVIGLGLGVALAGQSQRLWVASFATDTARLKGFSLLYRTHNAAAGLSPLILFHLPYQQHPLLIIALLSGCYIIGAVIIGISFPRTEGINHAPYETTPAAAPISLARIIIEYKSRAVLYAIFFLSCISTMQLNILPYYFKKIGELSPAIGLALSINPIMVVLLQGIASRVFIRCDQWQKGSGFLLGFACIVIAFIGMGMGHSFYNIYVFIGFATLAEMIIFPHLDSALVSTLPAAYHPFLFAGTSIVFGLGQMGAESGTIMGLELLTRLGLPMASWWWINAVVFGSILALGFFKK